MVSPVKPAIGRLTVPLVAYRSHTGLRLPFTGLSDSSLVAVATIDSECPTWARSPSVLLMKLSATVIFFTRRSVADISTARYVKWLKTILLTSMFSPPSIMTPRV